MPIPDALPDRCHYSGKYDLRGSSGWETIRIGTLFLIGGFGILEVFHGPVSSMKALLPSLFLLFLGSALSASAEPDCAALSGDEAVLPGEFLPSSWKSEKLPDKGDIGRSLEELDYGDELPVSLGMDLNNDGKEELFLTSPGGRSCGNAGCPYILLENGSMKLIGKFFGHLAVLDERVNKYRIIQSFSRLRVEATNLDTWVFDGKEFRQVSHAILDPCGFEQWGRRIRKAASGK